MHAHGSIREALGLIALSGNGVGRPREDAVVRLLALSEQVGAMLRRQLAEAGLTVEGFQTLASLRRVESVPTCPTALAEATHTTNAFLSLTLARLEGSGLITRQRVSEDRRVVCVKLTDAGRSAVEQAARACRSAVDGLLEHLPDEQVRALRAACDQVDYRATRLCAG